MNSHSGITESKVFEIADQLLATGQTPTLKSIRDDLKTGSFTTIANHLAKWKKMKLEQTPTPQPPSEFQASTMRIWDTAYREAEKLFANERDIFESKNTKWHKEKLELLSIIEKQENDAESNQIRERENQTTLDYLNKELGAVRDSLTKVTAQSEAAEIRRLETLERADRLEAKLTQLLADACLKENEIREAITLDESRAIYLNKNKKEVEITTG